MIGCIHTPASILLLRMIDAIPKMKDPHLCTLASPYAVHSRCGAPQPRHWGSYEFSLLIGCKMSAVLDSKSLTVHLREGFGRLEIKKIMSIVSHGTGEEPSQFSRWRVRRWQGLRVFQIQISELRSGQGL
jgi:hypothetical protein